MKVLATLEGRLQKKASHLFVCLPKLIITDHRVPSVVQLRADYNKLIDDTENLKKRIDAVKIDL